MMMTIRELRERSLLNGAALMLSSSEQCAATLSIKEKAGAFYIRSAQPCKYLIVFEEADISAIKQAGYQQLN